ncbi:transglutaminase-like domain-containing protein [Winogradskyella helgolandensis]|uniref:transglutaminase-like domain-containing protein n=1 Tax=Winogradskyella helgolandensis TaxID=2697010 RepID=UPI0015B7B7A1|nr:transglutaminase domain-containing protein [Winogradskyella helgolandensis]
MNSMFRVSVLILLMCMYSLGFTQDMHIKSKSEHVQILKDSSFTNQITIHFPYSDEPRLYPIFYDTELEKVSDIQLFEIKGRRLKKITLKKIKEEQVNLDYITSQKVKSVFIPAETEVKLTYTVSCRELMYFSSLPLFSYNQIDTLNYKIDVPNEFVLNHNTIHKDLITSHSIDSIHSEHGYQWKVKVAPMKVEPDPLQFFGIYKNMKVPLMRVLVMPKSYENQSTKYMNDWYFKNVLPQKGLNTAVRQKLDELTYNVSDSLEVVNIIYHYVRTNFKYVAIEIGMGAFIPTHSNTVFSNKEGDCKDLSNFLSEALRYKGIHCDLALAATFDHISDCDFPSLSSANHVICVAYINDEKLLLDPTDPIHVQGTPVQSLQDRTILIVNAEGGDFYKVERFKPEENKIKYQLNLKINPTNDLIEGTVQIDYTGVSGNYLRRIQDYEDQKDFATFSNTFFEEILGNQKLSNLVISDVPKELDFKSDISINGKTFSDGENRYLFIDFLPRLIDSESRETLIEGTYLNNTFNKIVTAKIKLNEAIDLFEPIEYNYEEEGMLLRLTISAISNFEIECYYDFSLNHIFVEEENVDPINKILNSFKTIINEPIVLKKLKD